MWASTGGTVDHSSSNYQALIRVEAIPPLPATANALLQLLTDPDVEIDELVAVIERDPPLMARLMGIANSAFYAPRQPVTTLKSAIVTVLGLNMVRNVAFGMALTGGLSVKNCPRFDLTRYWVLALGTADLSAGLARAANLPRVPAPDAIYLSGLLHNIGELLLAYLWPVEVDRALSELALDPLAELTSVLRKAIGIDHWMAGAFLARHWQLPAFVADDIEGLARVNADSTSSVRLLNAARRWVAGVAAGCPDTLRLDGVDAAYCEYRSTSFIDRFGALEQIAVGMR